MPIPFHNHNNDSPETAGYLKFLTPTAKDAWLGALFIMNARGEPVEFTHARVSTPNPLLWLPDGLRTRCQESICTSIFDLCPAMPDLMLCLAEEVDPRLFGEHLSLEAPPICRIAHDGSGGNVSTEWINDPIPDSPSDRLYKRLCERGLLLEPFARAEAGLRQIYSELTR